MNTTGTTRLTSRNASRLMSAPPSMLLLADVGLGRLLHVGARILREDVAGGQIGVGHVTDGRDVRAVVGHSIVHEGELLAVSTKKTRVKRADSRSERRRVSMKKRLWTDQSAM